MESEQVKSLTDILSLWHHESRQWEVLVIKTFFSENSSFHCFKGQPRSQEFHEGREKKGGE